VPEHPDPPNAGEQGTEDQGHPEVQESNGAP
jgi:hypothetical protein